MAKVLILHGPNLNMLGNRESNLYGYKTLEEINSDLMHLAKELEIDITTYQSNAEHMLIEKIHDCNIEMIDFMIFNPAAYTHTSIALRDAILTAKVPFIEVHLSNIAKRESFRKLSYFSDIAIGTIQGLGQESYMLALHYANIHLKTLTNVKEPVNYGP